MRKPLSSQNNEKKHLAQQKGAQELSAPAFDREPACLLSLCALSLVGVILAAFGEERVNIGRYSFSRLKVGRD